MVSPTRKGDYCRTVVTAWPILEKEEPMRAPSPDADWKYPQKSESNLRLSNTGYNLPTRPDMALHVE
jgi:hypothetical protein